MRQRTAYYCKQLENKHGGIKESENSLDGALTQSAKTLEGRVPLRRYRDDKGE